MTLQELIQQRGSCDPAGAALLEKYEAYKTCRDASLYGAGFGCQGMYMMLMQQKTPVVAVLQQELICLCALVLWFRCSLPADFARHHGSVE